MRKLRNPYYIGDQHGLTRTNGSVDDAWTVAPSVYAVAARETKDVGEAVNFAPELNMRSVVKGGGHSNHGISNAPDSLLIWTRVMNRIILHAASVGKGCAGAQAPQHTVTVEADRCFAEARGRPPRPQP